MITRAASLKRRLPSWAVGLIALGFIVVGSYLAWTKQLPWTTAPEIRAVFSSAHNVSTMAPVRVAGVDVGSISNVEPLPGNEELLLATEGGEERRAEQAAVVTMELYDNAPTIRTDATLKIRPRLFLEGNYFVELTPGSPSAEPIAPGHTFPVNQTSQSVHLDQLLTTLQADVRADLQDLLIHLGSALVDHGGAEGFRELFRTSGPANRFTARVNEAFLGTQPEDLRGMIRGFQRVFRGLGRNDEALRSLVTNLSTFTGSFAAEHDALGEAIELLPRALEAADPAFTNLNASFPGLRAFAREALPGVRSSAPALRVSTPFVAQLRRLMGERELRGLVRELRPTVPHLVRLAEGNVRFLRESRALSSCFNQVIIPWSHSTVEPVDPAGVYPHEPTGRVFEQTGYGLAGISQENRSGDANANYIRVLGSGGPSLARIPSIDGLRDDAFALTPFPILGTMPRIDEMARKPGFQPDGRCEQQEPPNLEAGVGAPPAQETLPASAIGLDALSGPGAGGLRDVAGLFNQLGDVPAMRARGEDAAAERIVSRAQRAIDRLGLVEVDLERLLGGQG